MAASLSIGASAGRKISARTADGVMLRGVHLPAPTGSRAFVVGHGFTNSTATPGTSAVVGVLARFGAVIALDFRGHGSSDGFASLGRDEVLDLDAAVEFARAAGYGPICSIGFSMGASIALRHAALGELRPQMVISVSSPSRWYIRESGPMRRVHWLLESPFGPAVGRLVHTRLGAPWPVIPRTPLEVVELIAPIPLLLVHGTDDHYFSPAHALALRAASRDHADLWIEDRMGHAESATTAELLMRVVHWAELHGHAQSAACADS